MSPPYPFSCPTERPYCPVRYRKQIVRTGRNGRRSGGFCMRTLFRYESSRARRSRQQFLDGEGRRIRDLNCPTIHFKRLGRVESDGAKVRVEEVTGVDLAIDDGSA